MEPCRILLVDDDANFRRIVEYNLREYGFEVVTASNGVEALDIFRREPVDLVLTDIRMPPYFDGLELLERIHEIDPSMPVQVITAFGSVEVAVEAMQRGAVDFVTKPFEREDLKRKVNRALKARQLEKENRDLRLQLKKHFAFENIIGRSKAMKTVFGLMSRLVQGDSTVLIRGESGTGKELVAQALHYKGPRSNKRFVAINCSAIPSSLLESELFGHVKGAFTGAESSRMGRFEAADKGSLFLDEIGDMSVELQSKILRVLQEREIERVGSQDTVPVNVRVICATHRNLEAMVEAGEFRQDLFYRLSVVPVVLPPLRERLDDIPLLARHFLKNHDVDIRDVGRGVFQLLAAYKWPGNVRELENVIERAVIFREQEGVLTIDDFQRALEGMEQTGAAAGNGGAYRIEIPDEGIVLDEVEKELISQALEKSHSNQTRAAELLGITRQTLIYRMQKHAI